MKLYSNAGMLALLQEIALTLRKETSAFPDIADVMTGL
jgi:hypothetical protein